ncbi:MAG: glycosyltransferase family 2 protein, partial [Mobilitalea sp.]
MGTEVIILMATYNGEKYIEGQLKSIINQSFTDWKLIIRDDCSYDCTVDIIKKYVFLDERISLIEGKENLGQAANFSFLLGEVLNKNYVMFCDQDDIWTENKVEISIDVMKSLENEKGTEEPILVYTDLRYVNNNLEDIKGIYSKKHKNNLRSILGSNYIYGCTIIINSALKNISYPIPAEAQNHDYWIALNAALYGSIIQVRKKTILYRQHNNNVTGGLKNYSLLYKVKKIIKLNDIFKGNYSQVNQNLLFCDLNKKSNNHILLEYKMIFINHGLKSIQRALKFRLVRNSIHETIFYYIFIYIYGSKRNN